MNKKEKIATAIMNKRFNKEDIHHSISMPIYSSVAFEFETAEEIEDAFLGKSGKHTYSRISNPTVEHFEAQVKAASGAKNVTALASGMAAISNTFLNIAYSGANIVTSTHLFANTFSLFLFTLKNFGVEIRFCNLLDNNDVERNIDENTCAVFAEIITNPHLEVVDLKALSQITKEKKVPLIADTTIVPWNTFIAKDFGVDIEIVSSTKYISGGATSIGGLILDHETYNWENSKTLKVIAEKSGKKAFHARLRGEVFRNIGACMSPYTAYSQSIGLETLEIRFLKAADNCLKLAEYLQVIPLIQHVNYTGLKDNPFYSISQVQFGDYPGAMLTFTLADKKACYAFMNKLKLIRRATNLFDNKSLIIHPFSTIYGTLSPEYKAMVDVPNNMMRLSVGLENIDDLKEDISQALKSSHFPNP